MAAKIRKKEKKWVPDFSSDEDLGLPRLDTDSESAGEDLEKINSVIEQPESVETGTFVLRLN